MDTIYHIAARSDWEQALRSGEYVMSTRGRTLVQEGFIHCSEADQVAGVANYIYRDAADLVLLVIDPAKIRSDIRYDDVPGEPKPYPHIYGPLNTDAVVEIVPFAPDETGTFSLPER